MCNDNSQIDEYQSFLADCRGRLQDATTKLLAHLSNIKPVTSYCDLTQLDASIISLLVEFEYCRVSLLEDSDESIDFRSSGHHRDVLEIYQSVALNADIENGLYIHVTDNGKLLFSPYDQIVRSAQTI